MMNMPEDAAHAEALSAFQVAGALLSTGVAATVPAATRMALNLLEECVIQHKSRYEKESGSAD